MSRPDLDHANLQRLKSCPGPHLFELVHERGEVSTRARFRCGRCAGELSEDGVRWYRLGLKHGLDHADRRLSAAGASAAAALRMAAPVLP